MRPAALLALLLALPAASAVRPAPPPRQRVAPARRLVKPGATARPRPAATPPVRPAPLPPEPAPTALEVGGEDPIELRVPHAFARATARERITQLLLFWREAYGVLSEWQGNRVRMQGSVLGIDVQGLLLVTDGAVVGLARNPGWLWRGRAQSYVEWMLRKYLHPTYAEPPRDW
jgi:hypothetical protein